jgi:peptidoglycan/LPS O-acetylase OafA/YrhL
LEALRFMAAFAVLIWHYQHFAYFADKPVDFVRDQLPLSGSGNDRPDHCPRALSRTRRFRRGWFAGTPS